MLVVMVSRALISVVAVARLAELIWPGLRTSPRHLRANCMCVGAVSGCWYQKGAPARRVVMAWPASWAGIMPVRRVRTSCQAGSVLPGPEDLKQVVPGGFVRGVPLVYVGGGQVFEEGPVHKAVYAGAEMGEDEIAFPQLVQHRAGAGMARSAGSSNRWRR